MASVIAKARAWLGGLEARVPDVVRARWKAVAAAALAAVVAYLQTGGDLLNSVEAAVVVGLGVHSITNRPTSP